MVNNQQQPEQHHHHYYYINQSPAVATAAVPTSSITSQKTIPSIIPAVDTDVETLHPNFSMLVKAKSNSLGVESNTENDLFTESASLWQKVESDKTMVKDKRRNGTVREFPSALVAYAPINNEGVAPTTKLTGLPGDNLRNPERLQLGISIEAEAIKDQQSPFHALVTERGAANRPFLLRKLSHIGRGSSAAVYKTFHAGRFEVNIGSNSHQDGQKIVISDITLSCGCKLIHLSLLLISRLLRKRYLFAIMRPVNKIWYVSLSRYGHF